MTISDRDRRTLHDRAGGECSFSECRERKGLQEAHIVGKGRRAARYDSSFPKTALDKYDNLILLCPTHHYAVIDDQDERLNWPAERLRALKAAHEEEMAKRRGDGETTFQGKAEAFAVKAKKVTGGKFAKGRVRILPGSSFSASAVEADEVTGLQIGGD